MKQIITGPLGRIAYHNASRPGAGSYPALNVPCREFARGEMLVAANETCAPTLMNMPRHLRGNVALAMFGTPEKREG